CGNPIFQTINKTAKNHRDNSNIQRQFIKYNELPLTKYKLIKRDGITIPHKYYHVHRRRAINTNERTFISSILPPNIAHLRSCYSVDFANMDQMLIFSNASISLIYDYIIRATGKEDLVFD